MNLDNVKAAIKYMKEIMGWVDFEVIETRDDPKVDFVTAVRFKISDPDYRYEDRDKFCLLVNYGEVIDEFTVEKDLSELRVGEPRFF